MPTLQFPYKGVAIMSAPPLTNVRVIDVNVRMGTDVVMGTATDDIVVADLPAGTVVLSAGIEQVTAGTGSGTLIARVGTTAASATLASTAAVGTLSATVASYIPVVVPAAGATLNVLGATAVRNDGEIRVWAVVAQAARLPNKPISAARDATL